MTLNYQGLPTGNWWGGLGRVDIRKGSDMYFDTRNMLK